MHVSFASPSLHRYSPASTLLWLTSTSTNSSKRPCLSGLYLGYLLSMLETDGSIGFSRISRKTPAPVTPVVDISRQIASLASRGLLLAKCTNLSASTTNTISGLSRSPFGSGSSVSLSTLRHNCYRMQRKIPYLVVLAIPSKIGLSPARYTLLFPAHGTFV